MTDLSVARACVESLCHHWVKVYEKFSVPVCAESAARAVGAFREHKIYDKNLIFLDSQK